MNFAKYISVIIAAMLKFGLGPLTGLALKLYWLETATCSVLGMMLGVCLVLFFEGFLASIRRRFRVNKSMKVFTKVSRLAVKTRQKFGLVGIVFLTPVILTPIGGTIFALAFGYSRNKIIGSMFLSAVCWAIVQTLFFYFVKEKLWSS